MKRTFSAAVLIGCVASLCSCSTFAYLFSDDYLQAGIRITADPGDVSHVRVLNRWTSEFPPAYRAQDVGEWAANRLAKEGRHDEMILVELISSFDFWGKRMHETENMWRISVYPISETYSLK
jgi:hypothetical protein